MVLWIDQNELATKLFEKVFKEQGKQFYTLTSATDFSYLVSDLNPSLIVIDAATALRDLEAFKKQYSATEEFGGRPVVIRNPLPGLEFLNHVAGEIQGSIDPFTLPARLESLIR